ncbi:MAG: hypothetical protein U5M51_02470 [Emticicia sp.]|nr:hypothetical protein [Emticicia sp.]
MKHSLRIVFALVALVGWSVSYAKGGGEDPTKTTPTPAKKVSKYRTFMPATNLVSPQILSGVEQQIQGLEKLSYG